MYQPAVRFRKFVAIDWSGAAEPIRDRDPIQVAEYVPATGSVGLVPPLHGDRWTRAGVVEYVQQTVNDVGEGPVMIGFDFAFAYPYCDQDNGNRLGYFPGAVAPPQTPRALWAAVEEWCHEIGNYYGAPFFRDDDPSSPYKEYYHYQYFTGDHFRPRFRITDNAAAGLAGRNPNSVFNCIGAADVGTGSVAGMRVLHEFLARVQDGRVVVPISIWPFDANGAPAQSAVVEIYPRVFLNHAAGGGNQPAADNLRALCAHFGAGLQNPPGDPTNDQRDALVSAAGMGWFTQQGQVAWQVPACAAEYEGWIFGVPVPPPAP